MSQSPIIGQCIYCGSTDEPLTREHVVPSGLAGDVTLLKASCDECREITRKLEERVLRNMLGNTRIVLKMPTRHKHERPSKLPIFLVEKSKPTKKIMVDAGSFPFVLMIPIFSQAGFLSGMPMDVFSEKVTVRPWYTHAKGMQKQLTKLGGNTIVPGTYNLGVFSRFIAKIAHGIAVHHLGVDGFEPFLNDFIRGNEGPKAANYWVGCEREFESAGEHVHTINVHIREDNGMVTVLVQLFAFLGAPTFHVIVGKKL